MHNTGRYCRLCKAVTYSTPSDHRFCWRKRSTGANVQLARKIGRLQEHTADEEISRFRVWQWQSGRCCVPRTLWCRTSNVHTDSRKLLWQQYTSCTAILGPFPSMTVLPLLEDSTVCSRGKTGWTLPTSATTRSRNTTSHHRRNIKFYQRQYSPTAGKSLQTSARWWHKAV